MAEESISKRQAVVDALLRKQPELVVTELTIRYDQFRDEHSFYADTVASALTPEQGATLLSSPWAWGSLSWSR